MDVPKAEAEDEIDEVEEAEAIDEVQEAEEEEEEERIEQDDAAAVTRDASNADEAPKKKDGRAPTMLPSATVIAARPVLRDLMREVTSMVPSALRRRQAVKPEIIAAAPLAKATIAPAAPGTLTAPTLSAVAPALSAVAPTTIISHSSAAHRSKRKLITAAPDLSDDNEEEEEYAQQLSLSDRLRLGVVGRDSAKASSVASAAPQSGDADAAYKDLLKELGESS